MRIRFLPVLAAILGVSACGGEPAEDAATEAPAEVEAPAAAPVVMPRSPSAEGARVFFITPADGDAVTSPVRVEFGIEGMTVAPAGDDTPHSGHHHLLIDTELPDLGLPIPNDANHVHFGDGSTVTEIELEPGEHTLQMLLGDHLHIPHDPPLSSAPITVVVESSVE
ncbi:MAG: DUF4399 domain-containing protein [Woeseiaceae bacterium]|nr:DUF4399 domain-containing protein [Woeseiaceae bacterium]